MRRRTLLKLGATSAVLLAGGGALFSMLRPGLTDQGLSPPSKLIFSRLAEAVLEGALPTDTQVRTKALTEFLQRLDAMLKGFPRAVTEEISQLLSVLGSAPGRIGLTGLTPSWEAASVTEIQTALQSMRVSNLSLRQQSYHALRDLINAAHFADPSAWSTLGYPGPPQV